MISITMPIFLSLQKITNPVISFIFLSSWRFLVWVTSAYLLSSVPFNMGGFSRFVSMVQFLIFIFCGNILRLFHNLHTLTVDYRNSFNIKYSHPHKPLKCPGNRCWTAKRASVCYHMPASEHTIQSYILAKCLYIMDLFRYLWITEPMIIILVRLVRLYFVAVK